MKMITRKSSPNKDYVSSAAPSGEIREQLSRQLLNRVDKTAAKATDIPDDEIDAAIDEAADHVRHHPEIDDGQCR